MPRCLYCLGWYLSETDELQGSSCECGENVCEDDKRAECERGAEALVLAGDHDSPEALKIEQRLTDEDRCGWKRRREGM
jgi:hypothetical protein